jgi:hypothetical protein
MILYMRMLLGWRRSGLKRASYFDRGWPGHLEGGPDIVAGDLARKGEAFTRW